MHGREFCKPDKTLKRKTWLTGWQKLQLAWLSQKFFSLRLGFFKLHLQHHFITTQAARNKYVNMQWIILHFIWAQRCINWNTFFKKVEPWCSWLVLFCSVPKPETQVTQGTGHQCSICSITDLTLYNKENQTLSLCQEQWEREMSLLGSGFPFGTTFRGVAPHHLRL